MADELNIATQPFKGFDKDRGFHFQAMQQAAEEMRMEGKGSSDPYYDNSKKNR